MLNSLNVVYLIATLAVCRT